MCRRFRHQQVSFKTNKVKKKKNNKKVEESTKNNLGTWGEVEGKQMDGQLTEGERKLSSAQKSKRYQSKTNKQKKLWKYEKLTRRQTGGQRQRSMADAVKGKHQETQEIISNSFKLYTNSMAAPSTNKLALILDGGISVGRVVYSSFPWQQNCNFTSVLKQQTSLWRIIFSLRHNKL